jgi:uncharacterized phage protein (TIGR02220 family)
MYTRIDELIWKDAKLKKISNESKLLFIYLLSCQHRNVLGLYNLPKYYVQGDLGYSFETVSKGLEELFNNGFITYDDEAETILVNNFLKYNPLENPNQVKGALKVMPTIPKTQLFYKLVDVINSSENTHLHELKAGIECYLKSNGFERVTLTVSKQEEVKEEVTVEVLKEIAVSDNQDVIEIVDHLNNTIGSHYGYKAKATLKVIKARMAEGFTVDDFKIVIDKKAVEWTGTEFERYLVPETLFGNKFEGYLNQKGNNNKKEDYTIKMMRGAINEQARNSNSNMDDQRCLPMADEWPF